MAVTSTADLRALALGSRGVYIEEILFLPDGCVAVRRGRLQPS
jgi:hypothetical protein